MVGSGVMRPLMKGLGVVVGSRHDEGQLDTGSPGLVEI